MSRVTLKRAPWLALSLLVSGCFGMPTPLAPGLEGSVGLPYAGTLTDAEELPVHGEGFERYRPWGLRNYGTPELVQAIMREARQVAAEEPGGPPLLVGDLSARSGGRISGHHSHRSGRDVDLLYFSTTPSGVPVAAPGFVHYGPDGLAASPEGGYVRLDVARQWALFRAWLTDPSVEILWMFVSRDVESLIIDHARALNEPAELIWRAEQVLHQPRDSANHDDHVHIRIACTAQQRVRGCETGGPAWPWMADAPTLGNDELLTLPTAPVDQRSGLL